MVMFLVFLLLSPCCILGQVWYLVVSFLDLCHLSYFECITCWLHYLTCMYMYSVIIALPALYVFNDHNYITCMFSMIAIYLTYMYSLIIIYLTCMYSVISIYITCMYIMIAIHIICMYSVMNVSNKI